MSTDTLLALGWFALCSLVLFAILRFLKTGDDAGGDGPHGDVPFVPADLKTLFHANPNNHGRQEDHAA